MEIAKDFQGTDKGPFLKRLPSGYWASEHLIMIPSTVDSPLKEPLNSLVAFEYVFMEQKCSLLGLKSRNGTTVKLLYSVAKAILAREVRPHEATIDVLVDVCTVRKSKSSSKEYWKQPIQMDQETEVMPAIELEKQKRDLNAVAEFITEYI